MKLKPILKGLETAANICIVAASAKALYNKFSSTDDDDDEEDEIDEDDEDGED